MKKLIGLIALISSLNVLAADSYWFECHAKAVAAASAIDALNFNSSDRSSIAITERSQKKGSAKIEVAFSEADNRTYTVKLSKNRGATLQGNTLNEELGCSVDAIEAN